jgi:integrase
MKIPQAKQLPSGAWRVRVSANGRVFSITRQTEKEAMAEAMALKAGLVKEAKRAPADLTLREAINKYIELREAALSPSTIRGYVYIRDYRFESVMDRTINKTTDAMYQKAVNQQTKTHSPKTVKNAWCFVASVLETIADRKVECALPQIVRNEHEFLDPDQIPVFLDALSGTKVEIPALLALHGLRASEVLDVTWDDIDLKKKVIHVRGSAVLDRNNNLVHKKTNKNTSSRRDVPILIDQLTTAVTSADKSCEYVCRVKQTGLYNAINKVCRDAELPEVGTHGLRHSFASLCYHLAIPEQMTMALGGWSDPATMKKIYTHLANRDKLSHADALRAFFNGSAK